MLFRDAVLDIFTFSDFSETGNGRLPVEALAFAGFMPTYRMALGGVRAASVAFGGGRVD